MLKSWRFFFLYNLKEKGKWGMKRWANISREIKILKQYNSRNEKYSVWNKKKEIIDGLDSILNTRKEKRQYFKNNKVGSLSNLWNNIT